MSDDQANSLKQKIKDAKQQATDKIKRKIRKTFADLMKKKPHYVVVILVVIIAILTIVVIATQSLLILTAKNDTGVTCIYEYDVGLPTRVTLNAKGLNVSGNYPTSANDPGQVSDWVDTGLITTGEDLEIFASGRWYPWGKHNVSHISTVEQIPNVNARDGATQYKSQVVQDEKECIYNTDNNYINSDGNYQDLAPINSNYTCDSKIATAQPGCIQPRLNQLQRYKDFNSNGRVDDVDSNIQPNEQSEYIQDVHYTYNNLDSGNIVANQANDFQSPDNQQNSSNTSTAPNTKPCYMDQGHGVYMKLGNDPSAVAYHLANYYVDTKRIVTNPSDATGKSDYLLDENNLRQQTLAPFSLPTKIMNPDYNGDNYYSADGYKFIPARPTNTSNFAFHGSDLATSNCYHAVNNPGGNGAVERGQELCGVTSGVRIYLKINDIYYSDNDGRVTVVFSKGARKAADADISFFTRISKGILDPFFGQEGNPSNPGIIKNVRDAIINNITFQSVKILSLIIYLTLFGIGFLTGSKNLTKKDLVHTGIMIGLITWATSASSYDFFQVVMMPIMFDTFRSMSTMLNSAAANVAGLSIDTSDPYAVFDHIIAFAFSDIIQIKLGSLFVANKVSMIVIPLIYIGIFALIIYIFKAALTIIVAEIYFSVILILMPIFMIFWFFDRTRSFWTKAIDKLMHIGIHTTIVLFIMTFTLAIAIRSFQDIFAFKACWREVFKVPIIPYIYEIKRQYWIAEGDNAKNIITIFKNIFLFFSMVAIAAKMLEYGKKFADILVESGSDMHAFGNSLATNAKNKISEAIGVVGSINTAPTKLFASGAKKLQEGFGDPLKTVGRAAATGGLVIAKAAGGKISKMMDNRNISTLGKFADKLSSGSSTGIAKSVASGIRNIAHGKNTMAKKSIKGWMAKEKAEFKAKNNITGKLGDKKGEFYSGFRKNATDKLQNEFGLSKEEAERMLIREMLDGKDSEDRGDLTSIEAIVEINSKEHCDLSVTEIIERSQEDYILVNSKKGWADTEIRAHFDNHNKRYDLVKLASQKRKAELERLKKEGKEPTPSVARNAVDTESNRMRNMSSNIDGRGLGSALLQRKKSSQESQFSGISRSVSSKLEDSIPRKEDKSSKVSGASGSGVQMVQAGNAKGAQVGDADSRGELVRMRETVGLEQVQDTELDDVAADSKTSAAGIGGADSGSKIGGGAAKAISRKLSKTLSKTAKKKQKKAESKGIDDINSDGLEDSTDRQQLLQGKPAKPGKADKKLKPKPGKKVIKGKRLLKKDRKDAKDALSKFVHNNPKKTAEFSKLRQKLLDGTLDKAGRKSLDEARKAIFQQSLVALGGDGRAYSAKFLNRMLNKIADDARDYNGNSSISSARNKRQAANIVTRDVIGDLKSKLSKKEQRAVRSAVAEFAGGRINNLKKGKPYNEQKAIKALQDRIKAKADLLGDKKAADNIRKHFADDKQTKAYLDKINKGVAGLDKGRLNEINGKNKRALSNIAGEASDAVGRTLSNSDKKQLNSALSKFVKNNKDIDELLSVKAKLNEKGADKKVLEARKIALETKLTQSVQKAIGNIDGIKGNEQKAAKGSLEILANRLLEFKQNPEKTMKMFADRAKEERQQASDNKRMQKEALPQLAKETAKTINSIIGAKTGIASNIQLDRLIRDKKTVRDLKKLASIKEQLSRKDVGGNQRTILQSKSNNLEKKLLLKIESGVVDFKGKEQTLSKEDVSKEILKTMTNNLISLNKGPQRMKVALATLTRNEQDGMKSKMLKQLGQKERATERKAAVDGIVLSKKESTIINSALKEFGKTYDQNSGEALKGFTEFVSYKEKLALGGQLIAHDKARLGKLEKEQQEILKALINSKLDSQGGGAISDKQARKYLHQAADSLILDNIAAGRSAQRPRQLPSKTERGTDRIVGDREKVGPILKEFTDKHFLPKGVQTRVDDKSLSAIEFKTKIQLVDELKREFAAKGIKITNNQAKMYVDQATNNVIKSALKEFSDKNYSSNKNIERGLNTLISNKEKLNGNISDTQKELIQKSLNKAENLLVNSLKTEFALKGIKMDDKEIKAHLAALVDDKKMEQQKLKQAVQTIEKFRQKELGGRLESVTKKILGSPESRKVEAQYVNPKEIDSKTTDKIAKTLAKDVIANGTTLIIGKEFGVELSKQEHKELNTVLKAFIKDNYSAESGQSGTSRGLNELAIAQKRVDESKLDSGNAKWQGQLEKNQAKLASDLKTHLESKGIKTDNINEKEIVEALGKNLSKINISRERELVESKIIKQQELNKVVLDKVAHKATLSVNQEIGVKLQDLKVTKEEKARIDAAVAKFVQDSYSSSGAPSDKNLHSLLIAKSELELLKKDGLSSNAAIRAKEEIIEQKEQNLKASLEDNVKKALEVTSTEGSKPVEASRIEKIIKEITKENGTGRIIEAVSSNLQQVPKMKTVEKEMQKVSVRMADDLVGNMIVGSYKPQDSEKKAINSGIADAITKFTTDNYSGGGGESWQDIDKLISLKNKLLQNPNSSNNAERKERIADLELVLVGKLQEATKKSTEIINSKGVIVSGGIELSASQTKQYLEQITSGIDRGTKLDKVGSDLVKFTSSNEIKELIEYKATLDKRIIMDGNFDKREKDAIESKLLTVVGAAIGGDVAKLKSKEDVVDVLNNIKERTESKEVKNNIKALLEVVQSDTDGSRIAHGLVLNKVGHDVAKFASSGDMVELNAKLNDNIASLKAFSDKLVTAKGAEKEQLQEALKGTEQSIKEIEQNILTKIGKENVAALQNNEDMKLVLSKITSDKQSNTQDNIITVLNIIEKEKSAPVVDGGMTQQTVSTQTAYKQESSSTVQSASVDSAGSTTAAHSASAQQPQAGVTPFDTDSGGAKKRPESDTQDKIEQVKIRQAEQEKFKAKQEEYFKLQGIALDDGRDNTRSIHVSSTVPTSTVGIATPATSQSSTSSTTSLQSATTMSNAGTQIESVAQQSTVGVGKQTSSQDTVSAVGSVPVVIDSALHKTVLDKLSDTVGEIKDEAVKALRDLVDSNDKLTEKQRECMKELIGMQQDLRNLKVYMGDNHTLLGLYYDAEKAIEAGFGNPTPSAVSSAKWILGDIRARLHS